LKLIKKRPEVVKMLDLTVNQLYLYGVDARHLELIKLEIESKFKEHKTIPKADFHSILNQVLKNRSKEMAKAVDLILKFCSPKEETVEVEHFTVLLEYFNFHPHKVRKDKNYSIDILNALRGNQKAPNSIMALKESDHTLYVLVRRV
jgi:hypothetical protein